MSSKGIHSNRTNWDSSSPTRGQQKRGGRRGVDLDRKTEESIDTKVRPASPISLTSPTGITHSSRRPRPPLAPVNHIFTGGSFLAAEQFKEVAAPENFPVSSASRVEGNTTIPAPSEYVNLSSLNCAPPLSASQRQTLARYLPNASVLQATGNLIPAISSNLKCIPNDETDESSHFANRTQERSAFQRTGNTSPNRIRKNPTFDSTKERLFEGTKKVQETVVNSCLRARKVQVEDCANNVYDLYRDSCGVGNHRGDDQDFFTNHSSNPQAPESPNGSSDSDLLRRQDSTEDTIRKRSLRYPEAALLQNPDLKNDLLKAGFGSFGEDANSILDIPPMEDSPDALRDYRLAMLFQDDAPNTPVVPLSRLSRALNELDLQDVTVDDLHEELLLSKEVLAKTEEQLRQNDMMVKKQQVTITDIKATFIADKKLLHDRLQRESEENSKLQTKLSALQLEVSHLRSNLRSARSDLTKSSNKWMEESRNEITSKASGRSEDLSAEDSALVSLLRSQISDLKSQLEAERMHQNRSAEYDHNDVMRLKSHLERAEVELRRLKDATVSKPVTDDAATEELRMALAHSEQALRVAHKKEHLLAAELEDTKEILTSLEANSRAQYEMSFTEIRDLKQRIGGLENDAEKAHSGAQDALQLCRNEADDLRSEVQRLKHALEKEAKRAQQEAWKREKERLEFEYHRTRSEEKEKSFAEKIQGLEECLAKADIEAALRIESDRLSEEKLRDRGQITSDVGKLHRDLREKEGEELMLKARVKKLTEQVQNAEACAEKALEAADTVSKEAELKASNLERNLVDLQDELADATSKASNTQKEREDIAADLQKFRDREANLVNEMNALKARLASAESEVCNEKFRAEEERRMAVETDSERVQEINRLMTELHQARISNDPPDVTSHALAQCSEGRKVDESRLHTNIIIGREVKATLKTNAAEESMSSWYNEGPLFTSSSGSSAASIAESALTIPASNSSSPSKEAYAVNIVTKSRTLARRASPVKCGARSTSDSVPLLPYRESPRLKRSCILSPNWRKRTMHRMDASSTDSSCDTPSSPLSPPRLSRNGSTHSLEATPSPIDETDDSSAELLHGLEDIRKMPKRRLDITQIQRRLIQSTERLTSAKSKLKLLVEACDEHREGQNTLKNSVDFMAERIASQTEKVLDSPERTSANIETILRSGSDDQSSSHLRAIKTMRSTDEVLDRYRKYKATRLQMSPGSSAAIIDKIIEDGEQEI